MSSNELKKSHSRAKDELLAPTLSYGIKALRASGKTQDAKNLFQNYQSDLSTRQNQRIRRLLDANVDAVRLREPEHLPIE